MSPDVKPENAPSISSAGVPPAVSGASRPRFGEVKIRDRGRLPHWEKDSATYFVTFRLADSLPKSVLERVESERRSIEENTGQLGRKLSPDEEKKLQSLSSARIEQFLDSGAGSCHLKNREVAGAVVQTLCHFSDKRYRLFAWCIMPNHVHVVFKLFPGIKLYSVLHSWKSFSAKQVNRMLKTQGTFWQREYYDHLIRNEGEFERSVKYVANNPAKAGLVNWPWVWVWGQDAPATVGETPALRKDTGTKAEESR